MPFAKRYAPTTLNDYIYTAVGAETSVSGADDNGDTLSYSPATVRVLLDGVRLDPSDFTATDSTSITGLTALTAGQKITVDALGDSGNPIVSYTKTASDAKYALLGANSDITSLTGLTTVLSEAQGGTGLSALPSSGKILQVVSDTSFTEHSTTSTSLVAATTLSLSITPASASNHILLISSLREDVAAGGTAAQKSQFHADASPIGAEFSSDGKGSGILLSVHNMYLHSPASTSAITYSIYHRTNNASYAARTGISSEGEFLAIEIDGT